MEERVLLPDEGEVTFRVEHLFIESTNARQKRRGLEGSENRSCSTASEAARAVTGRWATETTRVFVSGNARGEFCDCLVGEVWDWRWWAWLSWCRRVRRRRSRRLRPTRTRSWSSPAPLMQ